MSSFPFGIFKVRGESMFPLIRDGNYVFIFKWAYLIKNPHIGDVVVLRHPKKDIRIIKRIKKINSDDRVFVAGDNKNESEDSRKFGYVYAKSIIGKVIFVL